MARKMVVFLIALLFLTEGILPAIAAARDEGKSMRVTATSLNVRGGPGTQHAVVRSVPKGGVVTVVEEQGDWCRVRLDDGTEGWASGKYLEPVPAGEIPGSEDQPSREEPRTETPRREAFEKPRGGGSALGAILKWGSLAGAAVAGGLAYSEKSKGDDSYEEYKDLFNAGKADEAEEKWSETGDHDDKAQMFAIVGGGLFGLFLLQQFVLGGGGKDGSAELAPARDLPLAWDPRSGQVRLGLTLARF